MESVEDRFVLLANRKSHKGFPVVLKSMTLNDFERHRSDVSYFALFYDSL